MNVLACRLCRKSLLEKDGCDACNPVRRHLVVLGEAEEERPSIAAVAAEAVAALRDQTRHYARQLRGRCSECGRTTDEEAGEKVRSSQRAAAGQMAKLLDSARKIQSDGLAAVGLMSFAEKAELFVDWYTSLPPLYREKLTAAMQGFEAQLALPPGEPQ